MNAETPFTTPEDVGFDTSKLSNITNYFGTYVEKGKLAGVSTLVARGGKIAHFETVGERDRENSLPMEKDTIFRIYSMSKPITSVALMMLYERGLFQLSHEVHRYIPSFKKLQVWDGGTFDDYKTKPCERAMTIRDLLTHTSGLTYGFMHVHPVDKVYRKSGIEGAATANGMNLEEFCDALADIPLLFSPGTQWSYSVATDVCGRLVEVLSGQPLDTFLQENIFDPLGMVDTGFMVPADKLKRFSANYEKDPKTKEVRLFDPGSDKSTYATPKPFFSGGGGLTSTMTDYWRFCQMFLNGGELDGVRILSPKTVDYMTLNHLPDGKTLPEMDQSAFSETGSEGTGFGLGFSVILDPAETQTVNSEGSHAWGGAASTLFWIDPQEDMVCILMTQLMPSRAYPLRPQMQQLVYGALVD